MRLLQLVRSHVLSIVVALLAFGGWPTAAAAQQPTPEPACGTVITVDTPSPGASVSGSLLARGWALDMASQDGSGVSQVHVYLDGEAGAGILLGGATLGQFRPDVDAVYGRSSSQAGWSFAWNLAVVPAGSHALYLYAQDACGWTFVTRPVVVSPTVITVDRPAIEATVGEGQPIVVDGWTLDPRAPSGTGIDAVHVYLDGEAGAAGVGVAALGRPRPDVAASLGRPMLGNAGFSLDTRLPGVLPGPHTLYVYAHSAAAGWSYRTLPFTLVEAPVQRPAAPAGRLFPGGAVGFDVSWPQCGKPLPAPPYQIAIVGATGGRAFYENPCLASQFAWARAASVNPSLYMNVNAPAGRAAVRGMAGPAGACRAEDMACQTFNFGYNAASHAVSYARSQGVTVSFVWLDVETENTWLDDRALNARVIQGAIEGLRAQGLGVGVYSTSYQWNIIAGAFNPGLPVWAAGGGSRAEAPTFCSRGAFGGGSVVLVQHPNGPFDGAYAC